MNVMDQFFILKVSNYYQLPYIHVCGTHVRALGITCTLFIE